MATNTLVCLAMIAVVSAVPLIRDDFDSQLDPSSAYQCARQCRGKPTKFQYKPSETYIYEYKAEAETSVPGASEDKAQMYIETYANIEVINTCEFALRLQNVRVYHSEPYLDTLKPAERMQEFQRELTANTLRFSFDDGVIRDICHPSDEKIWVLNFKRGLLSAFQISMDDLKTNQKVKEVDVTGECQVEYTRMKEWIWAKSIKVSKSKDLLACYHHSGLRTLIPMVPYKVSSDIQSLPVMKSSHECEYIMSSSRTLQSASCKESHVFAPFSNHQSGGATKIQQTLTFRAVRRGIETSQDFIESRSNLMFQHMNGIDEVLNSMESAEQKLKEICEQTKFDIRPETPRLFTELVKIVKVLDTSDLRNLYKMIKNKRLCSQNDNSMKFLLDALPIAGTTGAVDLMTTAINNDDIPKLERSIWLTSLSLIPEPSENMLPSLGKLLSGKNGDQALLPVSALLNTMCRKNIDCDRSYQFKKIVNKISQKIDSSCSSDDRSQTMETLRAIGNIGYGKNFIRTMKNCLSSSSAPLEVRVAAADAYRRFPCQDDEEKGPLFEVFESTNADSELRVMSFLSLMRCPRDSVLQKIAAQLDKEEDVQVGTFVYTHLENLKQTSDPHKQDIAKSIQLLDLKKFDNAGLKTSRSFESSTLINRLNLGYVANGDVIWSQSSVMPRGLRVNLTVEMFGNSINLFEAGARLDGFDHFVEKYFGTKGYVSQNEASSDDLEAFIYARMFGNELVFKHVKGTKEYEKIKSYINFNNILENLSKKYDFRYTHSQQLLDDSLIIPTAIGLPVNLTVNSSVTVDTNVKGKADFNGILSRSKPISITTDVAASAGLEVTGSMVVDAQLYKQGIRMRNTLHSSVNLKSNMMIKQRQILNFEIVSPQEKQEVFDARSQFFVIHDNFEKEQEMIKENRKEQNSCTGDTFAKVTGVELCGDLQYPNASMTEDAPYFPLTGPARATLVMNKKDTQRTYKIFAKWIRNSRKVEAQLQLDTPGSQVDRHISADATIGIHKNPHVDVVLISPWKKVVVNGKAAKNNDMASLTGSVSIDDDIQYKLTSELKMSTKGKRNQYLPFVEIENNGERITFLSGAAVHREKKDISSNLVITDLNKNSYSLNSQLIYSPQEKRIELSAGSKGSKKLYSIRIGSIFKKSGRKGQNVKIDPAFLIKTPKGEIVSMNSNGEFQHKPLRVIGDMSLNTIRLRKPITMKVDIRQKKNSYPVTMKFLSSFLTGDLKGKVDLRKNSYSSTMRMNYKTQLGRDSIDWNVKLLNRSKNSYTQYTLTSNLISKNMPEYNTISTFDVTQKKKSTAALTIYYGKKPKADKNKFIQVIASVNANVKNSKRAEIKADLKAKMPKKDVDIIMKLVHQHTPKKLESEVNLHLAPFVENDIIADIKIQNNSKSLYNITADGNLKVNGKRYALISALTQTSKKHLEHSLTISSGNKEKHMVVTVYKKLNNNDKQILTKIDSSQLKQPLSLNVYTSLKNPSNFHFKGALSEKKQELFSVNALSKLEMGVAGKWNLEMAHPQRKVKAQASFSKVNSKVNTDVLVNWNVRSDEKPVPQVRLTGHFTHSSESDSLLLKGNVKINTPFKDFEKLSSNMNFEKSDSEMKSRGKVSWGGIHKQISSEMSAKLPISLDNAKVSLQVNTPFKNYKDIELELDHKLDSKIKTILRGKLDRDQSELIINGRKDIDYYSRNIKANLTLKTPYQSMRQIYMNVEHSDDENEIKSIVKVNKDGERYGVDLSSSRKLHRSNAERSSKLILSIPGKSLQSSFTHKIRNGKHMIKASINASQKNKKKQISVNITGYYLDLNHLSLDVDVKSPLKTLRKAGLEIAHEIKQGVVNSKIIVELNRAKTGYDFRLKNKQKEKSVDVLLLLSPFYEKDVYLKSNVQFDNYPVTLSSQISWDPSSIIDISGSYKAQSVDDMEINLKLTTPFEDFENVNLVASNVLKNSVRVSHFNVDYDVRKMIDVEVRSQYEDLKKLLRITVKIPFSKFQSLDTGLSIDMKKGFFSKADLELQLTPEEIYEGVASLRVNIDDNVRGKIEIKTPIKGMGVVEGSFVRESRKNVKTNSLQFSKDGVKLVSAMTEVRNSDVHLKITIEGKILEIMAEEYDNLVEKYEIKIPNIFQDEKKNTLQKLINQLTIEQRNKSVQVDGSLTLNYGSNEHVASFGIEKTGEKLNDFSVDSSLTFDKKTVKGNLVFKLVNEDIRVENTITAASGIKYGIEFSHIGNMDQCETKGRFKLFDFEQKFDFFMSSIQRVEFTVSSKPSICGLEWNTLKYTHEGQDNRVSCSLIVEDIKRVVASINLIGQSSPIHLLSLVVKTPFKDYKEIVISGDYDETKINGLVMINDSKQISLSGAHDNFKNPKFALKTTLRLLKELSVNVDGELSDGSSSFILKFNDNDQIDGNVDVMYDSPSKMKIIAALNSRMDDSENNLKLEVESSEMPRKLSHLLLSLNDIDQIKFSTHLESQYDGVDKRLVDIELLYPSLGLGSKGVILNLEGGKEKATGKVQLLDDAGKILDADINIDATTNKKVMLNLQQPKKMEYSFTQDLNAYEVHLNWDKMDPDANMVIKGAIKDESSFYKMDKFIMLRLSCPSRSIGVEHSIVASRTNLESSGKIYWNDERENQLSYELQLEDQSNRRQKYYNGDLKIRLPKRTVGFSGYIRDRSSEHEAETKFSWDLDNDSSKKIGLKATFLKGAHTQADVSLILPMETHIDSKLVMNKGNTVLEGQTQIFYAEDSRKTITLFSKVVNNPGYNNFFYSEDKYNYSIQLGLSHPDSRIDIRVNSHLFSDSERLTTSIGLDYLTSLKQMKNTDLFMEINKLKKAINLNIVSPYKSVGLSGSISHDPMELRAATTVDNEEKLSAHLLVNPSEKKINLDWNNSGREFIYSALYPNNTALQLQRNQRKNGFVEQDVMILVQLPSPNVLQTNLNWRPGLAKETLQALFDNINEGLTSLKKSVDEIGDDIEREVTQKYRDISISIFDDFKSLVIFLEQELSSIEDDLKWTKLQLYEKFDFCSVKIGDFDLDEEITNLQQKIALNGELVIERIDWFLKQSRDTLRSVENKLNDLKSIDIEKVFGDIVTYISNEEERLFNTFYFKFLLEVRKLSPEVMQRISETLDNELIEILDPQPLVDYVNKQVELVKNVKLSAIATKVLGRNINLSSKLKVIIIKVKESVLGSTTTKEITNVFEDSEVYQMAKWFISYLDIEKTLPKRLEELLNLIEEVIEEEVKEQLEYSFHFIRNPITRFDPSKGFLQIELPLVISLDRLDELPNMNLLSEKVVKYLQKEYGWNISTTTVVSLPEGFEDYKPSRPGRPPYRIVNHKK